MTSKIALQGGDATAPEGSEEGFLRALIGALYRAIC
jgi:hypothetical protein